MSCIEAARKPDGEDTSHVLHLDALNKDSDACQMIGAAGNILIAVGETFEPDPRMIETVHATGEYLTSGSTSTGVSVRWLGDHLGSLRFG